ncbi:hypothetical protein CHS0354_039230, partial [Potamilus streckersoni]
MLIQITGSTTSQKSVAEGWSRPALIRSRRRPTAAKESSRHKSSNSHPGETAREANQQKPCSQPIKPTIKRRSNQGQQLDKIIVTLKAIIQKHYKEDYEPTTTRAGRNNQEKDTAHTTIK